MYWWAKLTFIRDPEKTGQTPDWKEKGRKQPTDFLGSRTVMGTHFAYVSWALEGGFILPAPYKNPTLPFQDTIKFIPGTSNHRVEGERQNNLPFNELDCNIKLHLVHHFQTDNRPPAVGKYGMPDAYSKHSLCGGKCVGEKYRNRTEKLFLSSLAPAINELHGCTFFFYFYTSYHHAQRCSTGQRHI